MKKIIFETVYSPFLLLGLIALSIAIFFKVAQPDSIFDVNIYNVDFRIATTHIWFLFTGYMFLLVAIYFIISRTKLRPKKGMIIAHYAFIVLFLIFFSLFLSFGNATVQKIIANIPFSTLITIYGLIFITDVVLFLIGIFFLILNLLSLKGNNTK